MFTHSFHPIDTPIILWAEGCLGQAGGKTATGVIRFGQWPVTAVIDSTQTGQNVRTVTGLDCDAPIVGSLAEALTLLPKPKVLMIGTAPPGGNLPDDCRQTIQAAIQAGLHIISGLHVFLQDDPDLAALAQQHSVTLWDVRHWPRHNRITHQTPRPPGKCVISMVGSDCSVGKMFTALELHRAALTQGFRSGFLATGQTAIMITGSGIPMDSLVGDFMAGTVEEALEAMLLKDDIIWLEGQGSLLHPAYSGVTLALLHGACPDAMVLCHNPSLSAIRNFTVPIPPLPELIKRYEAAASWARPANGPQSHLPKVLGIAVNTSRMPVEEAQAYLTQVRKATGLPATDPVRDGVDTLLRDCLKSF